MAAKILKGKEKKNKKDKKDKKKKKKGSSSSSSSEEISEEEVLDDATLALQLGLKTSQMKMKSVLRYEDLSADSSSMKVIGSILLIHYVA